MYKHVFVVENLDGFIYRRCSDIKINDNEQGGGVEWKYRFKEERQTL